MAIFSRWSNLKHFNNVTTTHFTDGQAFYDILKVRTDFVAAQQVVKFALLVHSSMYRGFPSKKIGPSTLHPCLSTVSNTRWPPLHDRKSIKTASTSLVSLPEMLHCQSNKPVSLHEAHNTKFVFLKDVSRECGKSFDFLKQHAAHHVAQDICDKGTVDNFSTQTGEGFQQEAAQAFEQTNMKDAEHQVCVL